jgi:dihydropteroate synthase
MMTLTSASILPWGSRTYIMGIINVTPDSFSGDGLLAGSEPAAAALQQAEIFLREGADILDIGGESTRPGSDPVGVEEESARVVPVIKAIRGAFPGVRLSVDTYKAEVAEQALKAGANWINDVWGLRGDPEMAGVAARHQAPVILMHNRLQPNTAELRDRLGGRYVGVDYDDLLEDICRELMTSVDLAHSAGIPDEKIILDPGIGFGKTVSQNLTLLNRLDAVKALGYPVLLGPSRKSFIGYTLDVPPDERVFGTAAAVAVGIMRGADIIRVHDVREMTQVARMMDAIMREKTDDPTAA